MESNANKIVVRFVLSHPVQYFSPLFKQLAQVPNWDFQVWYASDDSLKGALDPGFGKSITWDIPLLEGYSYTLFPNKAFSPGIRHGFFGLWNPDMIRSLQNNSPHKILIIHGWNYLTHLSLILKAKKQGWKIFLRGDNPLMHENLLPAWKQKIKKFILPLLIRKADKILFTGKENKLFFQQYGAKLNQLHFAPHAIENNRFAAARSLSEEDLFIQKENLSIPTNIPIILFCGKFIPKKRPLDLLNALLPIKHLPWFLIMIGEGELKTEITDLINSHFPDKAILPGFINQQSLPQWYNISDVLILPSGAGETWGLIVNEAIAVGLPVILSNLVGCGPDLIEINKNGFIYPCGNIQELQKHIEFVITNPEWRKESTSVSLNISQKYSMDALSNSIVQAVNTIFTPNASIIHG
jgi:glycosyltransferase involved in cell wall biosynthesis